MTFLNPQLTKKKKNLIELSCVGCLQVEFAKLKLHKDQKRMPDAD